MEVNTTAIAILIILFLVMILLRIQIAFAVGIASTVCLLYLGLPLTNVCQQMVKGLNSFSFPDGRTVLHYHGLSDGGRRNLR